MVANEPIFQLYRGGVPGANAAVKRDKLEKLVEKIAKDGFCAVGFHAFPREGRAAWDGLATIAASNGIDAGVCYGLDGETDGGKPFSGATKGRLMGEVGAKPSCAFVVCDAEGKHDDADEGRPGDVTDTGDVLDMGREYRKVAPGALTGTQHWYALLSHAKIRTVPVGGNPRDVIKGFPQDAFAEFCNWFDFAQAYCNHAQTKAQYGTRRYQVVWERMAKDRAKIEPVFKRAGLNWKPGVTIQAYGWDDMPWNCLDAIINECAFLRPVFAWCDWEPSPVVYGCAKAFLFLRARGFVQPGRSGVDTIRLYQTDWNKTAAENDKVIVDGKGGKSTLETMGIFI